MSDRVCAVVVTYNRKLLLGECLIALQAQTRRVDEIVVVNNASTDGTEAFLNEEFPSIQTLNLPKNVGGAGGFHAGMQWAYTQGFDWIWVMDDDGRPAPDCLEKLFAHGSPNNVLVPILQDSSGRLYGFVMWKKQYINVTDEVLAGKQLTNGDLTFFFVGPLIPKEVVEQAGLPNKDFFIWFDDCEYALRLQSKTNAKVLFIPEARFFHDYGGKPREVRVLGRRSIRNYQPPWKTYYGARNHLYTVTRTRRSLQEWLGYLQYHLRLLMGDILYEPDRWERVRMRLKGMYDGATGKLGKRV